MYKQVLAQTTGQYEALAEACEVQRPKLDAMLRTDMDQMITAKEHVSSKIRGDQIQSAQPYFANESSYFDNWIGDVLWCFHSFLDFQATSIFVWTITKQSQPYKKNVCPELSEWESYTVGRWSDGNTPLAIAVCSGVVQSILRYIPTYIAVSIPSNEHQSVVSSKLNFLTRDFKGMTRPTLPLIG